MSSSRVQSIFSPVTESEAKAPSDAITLGEDPQTWQAEVLQALQQTVSLPPEALPTIEIKMDQEDQEGKDASGAVVLSLHGRNIIIPVIIKDGQLYPLDVFYFEDDEENMSPLSTESMNEAIARGTLDYRKAKQTAGGSGYVDGTLRGDSHTLEQLQGPNGQSAGYSKLASPGDGLVADLIDQGAITKEAAAGFCASAVDAGVVEQLRDLPPRVNELGEEMMYAGMSKIGMGLMRLSSAHHVPESLACDLDRVATSDVFQVRMLGPGRFRLHATLDRVYLPFVKELSASEVRDLFTSLFIRFASKEGHDVGAHVAHLMSCLQTTGHVTVRAKSHALKPHQLLAESLVAVEADQTGGYVVKHEGGQPDKGLVFSAVCDLDGSPLPALVFVSSKTGDHYMGENIVGIRNPAVEVSLITMERLQGGSSRRVLFGWDGPGGVCVTPPMTLDRLERSGGRISAALCSMGLGRRVRLVFDDLIQSPVEEMGEDAVDGEGRRTYRFPRRHAAIRLGKPVQLVASTVNFDKLAGVFSGAPELLIDRHADGLFNVKIGQAKLERVGSADANLFLATAGASSEAARGLLEKAASGRVRFYTTLVEPITSEQEIEKLAAEHAESQRVPGDAEAAAAIQALVKEANILKLAAHMPDGSMADRMVALSFLTQDNITTFRRYIPDLERARARLARLVVWSRLSGKMDSEQLQQAMVLLDRTLRELKGVTQLHLDRSFSD